MSRNAIRPIAGQLHCGDQDQAMRRPLQGFDSRADGRSTADGAAEEPESRLEAIRDEVINAFGGIAAAVPVMYVAWAALAN